MKANKNKNSKIIVGIPYEWYRKDTPSQLTEGYDKHFTEEDIVYTIAGATCIQAIVGVIHFFKYVI